MTPNRLVALLRLAAVVSVIGLTVLLLGPFQGLERMFHLTDREAHAIAFFGVTLGLFAIAPRWRRTDLALVALAFGVSIELAQGLTGRSASAMDLLADGVGILAALCPGLIERLRHPIRTSPDVDVEVIRAADRRKGRGALPARAHVGSSDAPAETAAEAGTVLRDPNTQSIASLEQFQRALHDRIGDAATSFQKAFKRHTVSQSAESRARH